MYGFWLFLFLYNIDLERNLRNLLEWWNGVAFSEIQYLVLYHVKFTVFYLLYKPTRPNPGRIVKFSHFFVVPQKVLWRF